MKRVVIITHWDGDGLSSAAIILKKHPDAELIIARPHDLPGELKEVLKNPLDHLYILDVPPSYPGARGLIRKIAKETDVDVIDHHPGYRRSPPHLFTWSLTQTASQLTSMKVRRDRYLAMLGAQCDHAVDIPEICADAEILTHALRYRIADDDFKVRVAKGLASGLRVGQMSEVVEEGRKGEKKFAEILRMAKEREVRITPTFSVIHLMETHGFSGLIAEELSKREKIVMVTTEAWDEKGKTTFAIRRWDVPVNLGKMVKKICKQLGGNGGGHPEAAGGNVPSKCREELIKLIAEHVGSKRLRKTAVARTRPP